MPKFSPGNINLITPTLWRNLRAFQLYGATTDVGKTVVATAVCRMWRRTLPRSYKVNYIKPVFAGPISDSDERHVTLFVGSDSKISTKTLFQFSNPVSPHIAAYENGQVPPSDATVLNAVGRELRNYSKNTANFTIIETAGGVLSPAPSGTLQADLYRPLRLPVIFVADRKLGGIATTISGYESLRLRGYDIAAVIVMENNKYANNHYFEEYFDQHKVPFFVFPQPPYREERFITEKQKHEDQRYMYKYYELISRMDETRRFFDVLDNSHKHRVSNINALATGAEDVIWSPCTQHQTRKKDDILVIDSAYGDYFQVASRDANTPLENSQILKKAFDGTASWWTQGLGHGNTSLALSAAYAAGRFGHVISADAVHEPSLKVAKHLLRYLKNNRLAKVFYSDNGSTGVEVAVKMALRASCLRYGWDSRKSDIKVLGLKGSYHGDTIGAMDCSGPSPYSKSVEWYRGRGHWLDFPTVKMRKGEWLVEYPPSMAKDLARQPETFSSVQKIFELSKRDVTRYKRAIFKNLKAHCSSNDTKFGALILEPIILGAGGMRFVDPLYQRALVDVVRECPNLFSSSVGNNFKTDHKSVDWSGLPVVFDEVFTGLYRLGRMSAASFLDVTPDISVHAKLLTGGLVPLCVTLASQSIFDAFLGNDKTQSLLHGHSYTAHPVGCQVALDALNSMNTMAFSDHWNPFKERWGLPGAEEGSGAMSELDDWNTKEQSLSTHQSDRSTLEHASLSSPKNAQSSSSAGGINGKTVDSLIWSMWSPEFLAEVSQFPVVDSCFAIGNVLAIEMVDSQHQGYNSEAAYTLRRGLMESNSFPVHSRVLGSVFYLMTSLTVTSETVNRLEESVTKALTSMKPSIQQR